MDTIPVTGPWITQKEINYVTDAVTNAWYDKAGMYHTRFERAFASYVGRKYAIALPSCTSALHLSLLALDLEIGDEVIVPEITWIASSAPITYIGGVPVFADIDPQSWCLDANSFEENITPKTKAVVVVDLYGNMPDFDAILQIAQHHGIAVIEDAAQAIGAEYKGRKAGSFGFASAFSFHGTKTITTGEGGMLLTDDEATYRRCLYLRDHGREVGDKFFWNTEVAYKYRMSNMQAALGLAQLERINELVERKRQIFAWYQQSLDGVAGITLNHEASSVKSTYWMVTPIVASELNISKEQVMTSLAERRIDSRPFFYPLSSLPAYADSPHATAARPRNSTAYSISPFGVNLPSGFNMTQEQVGYVCNSLKEVIADSTKR